MPVVSNMIQTVLVASTVPFLKIKTHLIIISWIKFERFKVGQNSRYNMNHKIYISQIFDLSLYRKLCWLLDSCFASQAVWFVEEEAGQDHTSRARTRHRTRRPASLWSDHFFWATIKKRFSKTQTDFKAHTGKKR